MYKIVFTDIDGVLNSKASLKRRLKLSEQGYLDRNEADYPVNPMVGFYNEIIRATGAKIVISSTWRILHPLYSNDLSKEPRFRESLKNIFDKSCVEGEIIGVTPKIQASFSRGLEIQQWLKENSSVVSSYVIIDDNSDMLEEQLPYFVQTTWDKGLEQCHATKAIEILNSPR